MTGPELRPGTGWAAPSSEPEVCFRCGGRIKPGQAYFRRRLTGHPIHVACPTAGEIAHARRMGRPL